MTGPGEHIVVFGGTRNLGRRIAEAALARGADVTIVGRDEVAAKRVASEMGGSVLGRGCDITDSECVATLMAENTPIDHLIITAVDRSAGRTGETGFDRGEFARMVHLKTTSYADVVYQARPRLTTTSSVVMFSGMSMWRPMPRGAAMAVGNAGVVGLANALAIGLAPTRFNVVMPGIVWDADGPTYMPEAVVDGIRQRTPSKRLPTSSDIVAATFALTDNPGINGQCLIVDGGLQLT